MDKSPYLPTHPMKKCWVNLQQTNNFFKFGLRLRTTETFFCICLDIGARFILEILAVAIRTTKSLSHQYKALPIICQRNVTLAIHSRDPKSHCLFMEARYGLYPKPVN